MHELSIAASIVEQATELCRRSGGRRVTEITLRIGRLAGVHLSALRFGFDLVAADTPVAAATLTIVEVPVRVWCPTCSAAVELPALQRFACPACGLPTGEIRTGRELEIESLALEAAGQAAPESVP
jgi:hydrogenase nickel incorporation protein HypA/HybF